MKNSNFILRSAWTMIWKFYYHKLDSKSTQAQNNIKGQGKKGCLKRVDSNWLKDERYLISKEIKFQKFVACIWNEEVPRPALISEENDSFVKKIF